MSHDELETLWKETTRRLEALEPALRLNKRLATDWAVDRIRSRLRFVQVVLWYEASFSLLVALLLGSYVFNHLAAMRFALPALVLHLGSILMLGVAARQLVAIGRIDYSGPVVTVQKELAKLGVVRAHSNRWLVLSTPLLWAILVVVVPHGFLGFDVYRAFGVPWVAGNFVVAAAVLAVAGWASRRAQASPRGSALALLRWLGDDVTGRRVAAASASLADIATFEAEA